MIFLLNMRQIEGRNPVREALRAGTEIKKIFIQPSQDGRIHDIIKLAEKKGIPIITDQNLNSRTKTRRHQGVIAIAENPKQVKLKQIMQEINNQNRIHLILVISDIDYEHNLGTIMRSAESAGADAILVPRKAFDLTPVVAKSSAGASEYIPLIHTNLFSAVKLLMNQGLKIIALKEQAEKNIYEADLSCPLAIVIGGEDSGVKQSLAKYIDEEVSIPMQGNIQSLNMAVATSVCIFEAVRQRLFK